MKFGELLLSAQHTPWADHYIDYDRLKKLLHALFDGEESQTLLSSANGAHTDAMSSASSSSAVNNDNSRKANYYYGSTDNDTFKAHQYDHEIGGPFGTHKRYEGDAASQESVTLNMLGPTNVIRSTKDFQRELNKEVQKAVFFILQSMGELTSDLSKLMIHQQELAVTVKPLLDMVTHLGDAYHNGNQESNQKNLIDDQLKQIFDLRMEFLVRVGMKLLLLLEFIELNIESITKIVKKHDKRFAAWEESSSQNQTISHWRDSFVTTINSYNENDNSFYQKHYYERLRRQYLPRFAMYSPDPSVRCLFLLAADAGDCAATTNMMTDRKHNENHLNTKRTQGESVGSFGGWDVIHCNLVSSLKDLFQWRYVLKSGTPTTKKTLIESKSLEEQTGLRRPPSLSSSAFHSEEFRGLLQQKTSENLGKRVSLFLSNSMVNIDSLLTTSKKSLLVHEETARDNHIFFEPLLHRVQSCRRRLGQTTDRYARMVYAHEMLHIINEHNIQEEDEKPLVELQRTKSALIQGGDADGISAAEEESSKWIEIYPPTVSWLSKFLNLLSSGLYMCNYNIVAPSSGLYAKLLGFDPANASIIIGMTPLAVLGSSIAYSWWSSYSYRRALMFASVSCIVGNILYALALPFNSLKMVLVGRLLIGFGSARVINRRYIADYYSIEDRTSGMSALVSASALGMAVGPALASSFSLIASHGTKVDHPSWKSVWTIETAPGYCMTVLWSIYFVFYFVFFEEPARIKPNDAEIKSTQASSIELEKTNERIPLVKPQQGVLPHNTTKIRSKQSKCNIPVLISLMLTVVLKIVAEGLTSSTPLVGRYYFGWGSHVSGIYLALLSSLMLPINYFVANVSRRYDDHELILVTLGAMLVGILGILVYSDDGITYSETKFIFSGFIIFSACNAIEGPSTGLLSKTIPKSLAKGIFNAGLLATQAGTLGRVIGDFYFSSACFKGMDKMVNLTFEPMGLIVLLSILIVVFNYKHLQPRYDNEDDED